jgi:peptide-methionine (S)-S-oxide reductase
MLETKKFSSVDNAFGLTNRLMVFHLIDSNLKHFVFKKPLSVQETANLHIAMFGMGCFWGVEKMFWGIDGVSMTAVGYSAGLSDFPDYKSVCSRTTGHSEVVLIHFQPDIISFPELLTIFWESHDPTQGMRQGNDIGSQYRSGIYTFSENDRAVAIETKEKYSKKLEKMGFGLITTEILPAKRFYYAEEYHQQYLAKNPNGYCSLEGTGIRF